MATSVLTLCKRTPPDRAIWAASIPTPVSRKPAWEWALRHQLAPAVTDLTKLRNRRSQVRILSGAYGPRIAGLETFSVYGRMMRITTLTALVLVFAGAATAAGAAPSLGWTTVATRPHDSRASTQGLVAHGSVLLESTGLKGASSVRRVNPATGRIIRQVRDPSRVFGEGLTVLRGTAWQLTWRNHLMFGFHPITLRRQAQRAYAYEGWGLTTDGRSLIASDGTPTVRWMNPRTLRMTRSIRVHDGDQPIAHLNELEMINGVLWANVWPTRTIALIDPSDGRVRAWLDLSTLAPTMADPDAVLNGIAVDPITHQPILTGKLWPLMYVIKLAGDIPA